MSGIDTHSAQVATRIVLCPELVGEVVGKLSESGKFRLVYNCFCEQLAQIVRAPQRPAFGDQIAFQLSLNRFMEELYAGV